MASQRNWFIGQLVTQQDMREATKALEKGEQDLCADTGLSGVISGFTVAPTSPPSIGVTITAGLGYTSAGERVQSTGSPVTLAAIFDYEGIPTFVQNIGWSRIMSVFAIQDRLGGDARLDATNTTVYYLQNEHVKFIIVGGDEAASNPSPPSLLPNGILLADFTLVYGQTSIGSTFSLVRRQDTLRLTGAPFGVGGTGGIYGTHKQALQAIMTRYNAFVNGTGDTLASAVMTYGGSGTWVNAVTGIAAGTVESAIDAIPAALGATTTGASGAHKIGVAADTTTVGTIAASSLNTRLIALRDADNGVYDGPGATWTNSANLGGNTVEGAITSIVLDLASTSVAGKGTGGQKIGMTPMGNFNTSSVHGYFAQLIATAGNGGDGAARIGCWTGNAPLFFSENTVRGQLDELAVQKAPTSSPTFTSTATFNGPVVLLNRKVLRRARFACPDSNQTLDVTQGDRFVLVSPAAPRIITLKSTSPAIPNASEGLDFICHALAGAGVQFTFKREDGTIIATFVGSAVSTVSPCWAQFEFAGGVWRLGANNGSSWDGTADYRVIPGAGA